MTFLGGKSKDILLSITLAVGAPHRGCSDTWGRGRRNCQRKRTTFPNLIKTTFSFHPPRKASQGSAPLPSSPELELNPNKPRLGCRFEHSARQRTQVSNTCHVPSLRLFSVPPLQGQVVISTLLSSSWWVLLPSAICLGPLQAFYFTY